MSSDRVVSPEFVGRVDELSRMGRALDAVLAGNSRVVLVAGEAGVGKSRFVAQLLSNRRASGIRVLIGECSGFAPGAMPFEPIVSALRRLLRSSEDRAALPEDVREALRRLFPELRPLADSNPLALDVTPDQGYVFAQLDAVIDALVAAVPAVLLIEDLHWADRTTLEFLSYVCHGLGSRSLAIVCTYRDDELPALPAMTAWLADRRRDALLTEISLSRFSRAEVASQVSAILGDRADSRVVDSVYERSRGNAYYTEMLLTAVQPQSTPQALTLSPLSLPVPLRELVLQRTARVGAHTRELLQVIAVAGHAVTHTLLASACARVGMAEALVLTGLREAVDHHLLVPVADPAGYNYRHALLAEATYEQLLVGERERLHGVWADTLEEDSLGSGPSDSARIAEIALHHHRAGRLTQAFDWDLHSAQASEQVGGYAEAAHGYRRMLAAWCDVPDAELRAGMDRVDILGRLATSDELAGDVAGVRASIEEALALIDPAIDPVRAGLLQDRRSWSLYISGHPSLALEAASVAVSLVPRQPPSLARVVVLNGLGRCQVILGRGGRASIASVEATAMAELMQDPIAVALAASLQARVAWSTGGPDAVRLAREALRLGRFTDVQDLILLAFDALAEALDMIGNDHGVVQACYGGYEWTRRLGGANYGAWLLGKAIFSLVASGRTAEAERALRAALRVRPSGILDVNDQLAVAFLATLHGDFAAGRSAIERCRSGAPELRPPFAPRYLVAAAELELWAGDSERGFELAQEGLTSVAHTDYRRRAGTLAWLVLRAAADLSDGARARMDPVAQSQARSDAGRLRATWEGPAWFTAEARGQARTLAALRDAEWSRLVGRSDPEQWARAARYARACGRPHQRGYAEWRTAEALLMAGREGRPAAATHLRAGFTVASSIASVPLQREIAEMARHARIRLESSAPAPATDSHPPDPVLRQLTARETEVIEGLAEGLTNRQIAERLYISPRTVAVHVSSVLRKLGVTDRVQAAHVARRLHSGGTLEGRNPS
jgi:DNA-binding CsgD family transcriptional regulator/tetratricopeptide (TPR) repeat protein